MLRQLVGYEMKAYSRIMLPIFIALLAFAFGIGMGARYLPLEQNSPVMFVIAVILYALLFAAVVFATIVLVITRFYNNVLGREGYFMMSLPVSTNNLLTAKVISSLIWVVIGGVVGIIAALITGLIGDAEFKAGDIKELLRALSEFIADHHGLQMILWVIIILLSICVTVVEIYAACALGSQWNGHRLLGSIFAFVAFEIIEGILASVISHIDALSNITGTQMHSGFLFAVIGVQVIQYLIYRTITWYFVDRRLNLA